ncbi:MAG: phosphopantetheine-binding protein, partial [Candidatus Dormibacteria bacterium]
MTWEALWEGHAPPDTVASDTPERPRMTIKISGGNYGRRYPPTDGAAAHPTRDTTVATRTPPIAPTAPVHHRRELATEQGAVGEALSPVRDDGGLLHALMETQRQTAEAHTAYLTMAEASIAALTALADGVTPPAPYPVAEASTLVTNVLTVPPLSTGLPTQGAPPQRESLPKAEAAADPLVPTAELEATVLSAVSEQTGYPVEMLGPHMDLDADLGIDSITRVQILATLRPLFPDLTADDQQRTVELMRLRTVGEIAAMLRELARGARMSPPRHEIARGVPPMPRPPVPLARLTVRMMPTPAGGQPMPALAGPLFVTEDGLGVAGHVVTRLAEHGVLAYLGQSMSADAAGVVFLGGLGEVTSPRAAYAV